MVQWFAEPSQAGADQHSPRIPVPEHAMFRLPDLFCFHYRSPWWRLSVTGPDTASAENMPSRRTKAEWAQLLPDDIYRILFEEETEYACSSVLLGEKRDGTFICAACFQPLFDSRAKFESGTGWPSFRQALPGAVATKTDHKLAMPRTEYHCSRCGGHHGHVFDDGPEPTGKRYCNNGLALVFVSRNEELPALRA